MNKTRIVRVDSLNFAVQVLATIKNKETGEERQEWQDKGYYGHRLEWAAESAVHQAIPVDEPVTPAMVREAVKEIVTRTKGFLGEPE